MFFAFGMLTHMMADPKPFTQSLELYWWAADLERIADLATKMEKTRLYRRGEADQAPPRREITSTEPNAARTIK